QVSFAEVDPAESRRIFILEALVRGELDLAARFLDENRRLREALERIEHKRRQRDVLADERDLFDFYDARLPAEIHSAATLEGWLREQGEEGLRRLRMGQDVLLREEAGAAPAEQYPDALEIAGRRFPLAYRFEPGDPEDGVTLRTPLELLNTLDAARLSWLVPGLLREKLVELMKTLPKPTRRALTPLPRFADAALQRLGAPGKEPLAEALAGALSEVAGVTISSKDLDEAQLEPHLRLRVEVVDDSGQVLAASRDLQALQERFGSRAQARFMHRQGADMNRDGETGWVFGTLPRTVTTGDGVEAWPALVDQDDAVGLRLFETADEAAAAHAEGVYRLLALSLSDKLAWLQRHHGLSREAQLAWSVCGEIGELVSELCWHALYAAAPEPASLRDGDGFTTAVASVRQAIGPVFQRQGKQLDAVLKALRTLRAELEAIAGDHPDAARDMEDQLDDLVYPGFLLDLEPERLADYPRYLEALQLRLEALRLDPLRDARQREQVAPYWRRYVDRLESGADYDAALDRYRWLLAEYRVSVFAQRLGTREKVSPKRLDAAWREVERAA
ncbi:MAG: DUF3418 domain-containing protein, partial [Gammaproteobacteria bacterium]